MEISSPAGYVRMTRAVLAASGFSRQEVDGTVYWVGGAADAPPFVLFHGVNDQAGGWFTVAPALARKYRVVAPDLAGHGESEPARGAIPVDLLVGSAAAAIDAEVRGRFTLVGNSLGGWIAMLYTLAHPDRVGHLVLEAAGGLSLPFASKVVARDRADALEIMRAVHGEQFEPAEWMIDSLIERSNDSPMLRVTGVEGHYVDSRLGEIRVPTTLIWGSSDGVLPLSYAEVLRKGIAGSTLQVIEGAAHIPHLQKPERFVECLMQIS